ncbi:MAG: alanine racemase [Fusobacteriaceae bacterium]
MKKAWLEINFEDLRTNYKIIKGFEPNKDVLAVVKADAYGCGVIEFAKELVKMGVKHFGVSCLQEAIELRHQGIKEEILVFGAVLYDEYEQAFENDVQISVSRDEDIEYIENNNFLNPKVQMKIDTGMGRIGFTPEKGMKWLNKRNELKKTQIIGVFTHFSCSDIPEEDNYTLMQIEKFKPFENMKDLKYIHSQNSGGIIRFPDKCKGNLIRPGIMLYGYSDLISGLKPVARLKSIVTHVKTVEEDSYISYGKEYFAKAGTVIATVSIGYADGYPRRFSNCGVMEINGIPCKVLGKVCMDVTMVEVPKEYEEKVKIGSEVDAFYGDMYEQFNNANVSPYEFLVCITQRVRRIYVKNSQDNK